MLEKKLNESRVKCQNQNLRHIHSQMVCQKLCQLGVSRWGSLEESSFCMTFENQFLKIIFGARLTNQPTPAEFSEYLENIFKLDRAWSSHAATC